MSVSAALKMLRLELGMTQADLAKKLNKGYVTVNRWENGKGFPSRSNAKSIISVAGKLNASDECIDYLYDVLMPDTKRVLSATAYGFPDIDREFLFQLADGSENAVYVVEADTYNLLYVNRRAERSALTFLAERGLEVKERALAQQNDKRCYHYFADKSEPCEFCPLKDLNKRTKGSMDITIPESGRVLHAHVRVAKVKNRQVYVFYLTDVTEKNAELNSLYELTNDIPEGVGIYNLYPDYNIELSFMNTVLLQMIGRERQEALLKNELSGFCLIHPEDKAKLMAEIRDAICAKRNIEADIRMRVRDRQYHPIHLSARMLTKEQGKYTFYCLFHESDREIGTAKKEKDYESED